MYSKCDVYCHYYCELVVRLVHFNIIVRSKLSCTQNGASPVCAASHEGHTDVVELLVQAGADIHLATTEVSDDSHTVSFSL